jgi:hypothetical protein
MTQEVPSVSETVCSRKILPRALVFKAHDKDLHKIKELIKTQFPEVEIIYVTIGPAASIFALPNRYLLKSRTLPNNHFSPLSSRRFFQFQIWVL